MCGLPAAHKSSSRGGSLEPASAQALNVQNTVNLTLKVVRLYGGREYRAIDHGQGNKPSGFYMT